MSKSAIIAIGSEITTGDLVDSNSAWLAGQLLEYGIETTLHVSVSDEIEDIISAINYAKSRCDFIITTGGLGPTQDDLTRNAIAQFMNEDLEFDEDSWERVQLRLNERKTPILERHKLQSWFPKGSQVLPNTVGTADGIYSKVGDLKIWTLPGPPREMRAIWADHIMPILGTEVLALSPLKVDRWKIFAVPESELAELTEPLIKDAPCKIAFRASFPYVEVKLFYSQEDLEKVAATRQSIGEALNKYRVVSSNETADQQLENLMFLIPSLQIFDSISYGALFHRIGNLVENIGVHGKQFQFRTNSEMEDGLSIGLSKSGDNEYKLMILFQNEQYEESFSIPQPISDSHVRSFKYISEYCLLETVDWIKAKFPSASIL